MPTMSRTADYTIQGFLYQFNKTLIEVLDSSDDAEVTVEGVIEDIEVSTSSETKAIQCKYHETTKNFTLSLIYKPLLQMMYHFHHYKSAGDVKYVLFVHFPDKKQAYLLEIKEPEIQEALKSKNKDFITWQSALRGQIDIDEFLKVFSCEWGASYETLLAGIHSRLENNGISKEDIETIAYPYAFNTIANLSIKHDSNQRKITKK